MTDANERLDSWKAIADYLGRDVRTLRRWEEQGLPVRRVGGGRGSSVFAFKSEIDDWLRNGGADRPAAEFAPARGQVRHSALPAEVETPRSMARSIPRRWIGAAVVFAVIFFGWRTFAPSAAPQMPSVKMTDSAIVASGPSGDVLWRYDFPGDVRNVLSEMVSPTRVVAGPRAAVFAMTCFRLSRSGDVPLSGQLMQFSPQGKLQSTFEFEDRWTLGGTSYGGPWAVTDTQIDDSFGRRQIAVAAHHYSWWPSVVTILDDRFQRLSTFVNSGWVEGLRWISPDRLAIAGFNEALNGGMFAVLDSHDIDGASPEPPGTKFACDDCRSGRPVAYFVFPRSELNRVTGSRFNRAALDVSLGGISLHTDEIARENNVGALIEAVYEFSPAFELVKASYGDRYWDKHHALELEGKITHTREQCPERDGPPLVKMWTRDTGWTDIHPKR
jgi:hypothetical protein